MAETKAIDLPSRDQMGLSASVLIEVIWRASPPPRSRSQSCELPPRFDTKTIVLPSGDQRGWRSFLPEFVSRRGSVLPSTAASQIADDVRFPSRSTLVMT